MIIKLLCNPKFIYDVILIIFIINIQMHRLKNIELCLTQEPIKVMEGDFLKITDNRTGKTYEISVKESKDCYFVNAKDFGKIMDDKKESLKIYDPAYMNTICSTSKISYIDGDKGILEYRGYPI